MAASITSLEATPTVSHDTSRENLAAAADEFSTFLNSSEIDSDRTVCYKHANTSWSIAGPGQEPAMVLYPSTTQDVSSILSICHRRRIPVTSYSGGTSFSGALTATRAGICVDFQKMNTIIAVHRDDMDAVVQPGVISRDLNSYLATLGLFFPPDPSPDAAIGGMVAMSCSGTNAYRYGTMKEWVISLTVVLADGTIVKTRRRPRKSSAGYDLAQLMIGSEGTLGLVTEVVIKLTAAPVNPRIAIATFPDVHSAVRTSLNLTGKGAMIDAIELLDTGSMKAINISGISKIRWQEVPTLFLKFSGSDSMVSSQVNSSKIAAEQNSCTSFQWSDEEEMMNTWWDARKNVGKALLAYKKDPSDVLVPSDAAVPISRLADLMVASQKLLEAADMPGSIFGHVGDGNIHVAFVCSKKDKDVGYGIVSEVQRLAIEFEGTVTGEHGIGLSLRDKLVEEVGEDAVSLMRRIKLALDPTCILNCDKVFRLEASEPLFVNGEA